MSEDNELLVNKIKNGYVPDKSNIQERLVYDYLQEEDMSVDEDGSDIVHFLKHQVILVTGATGFLGKVLLEKLLRSCQAIDTIYLIVRHKKGVNCNDRVNKILQNDVFSKLREIYPDYAKKIVTINGDFTQEGIGLNQEDRKLLTDRVNIIYHGAATINFNEHIKEAVRINIRGTQELLKMAQECKGLKSFVYISTAFSNCNLKEIEEKFYEPPITTEEIYSIVLTYSNDELTKMTPQIIGRKPNTYTFTKHLAEELVRTMGERLPICVVRPSIVTNTWKEPIKGWVDNLNGPMGVMVGWILGVLRVMYYDAKLKFDVVPANYVVNACIAASYATSLKRNSECIPVYNYVSGVKNPLNGGDCYKLIDIQGKYVGTVKAIWYPMLFLISNEIVYEVLFFLLHTIPGTMFDLALRVMGRKPMLSRGYEKIRVYSTALKYFCSNEWNITDHNTTNLYKSLSKTDRKNFKFDIRDIDWPENVSDALFAVRRYIIKDPLTTLEEGWKKMRILKMIHYSFITFLVLLVMTCLYYLLFRFLF